MSEIGTDNLLDMNDNGDFIDAEVVLQKILDDPDLVQHVTRNHHEGHETIAGYFRVDFQPREQRQILHVPFTPPLKAIPQVDTHATDNHDVRIRVTDRQKFGIRAEIILPRAAESSQRVLVEIVATAPDGCLRNK